MVSTPTGQTDPTEDSDSVLSSDSRNASRKTTTHDFTKYQCGVDYYFELSSLPTEAYMTGQGKGIKPDDYILLQLEAAPQCYQVEIIDYYSQPPDMWVALLKPIA
ncbi:MAG: hypothetical protein KME27_05375 [Lyngbya sp. HA4199-MV5]|jgi:MioC protein|nr:hypothetical protein [Lyngbya sp. HA4199-MV5]